MQTGSRRARLKILIPREHGAWATLLVPFFIGTGVAGQWDVKAVALLSAILFLYLARYPLVLWARSGFKQFPSNGVATLLISTGHGLFLGGLLIFKYHLWLLAPAGLAGIMLLLVHLWLVKNRLERTASAEFFGVVTLTSTALVAFYTASGSMPPLAFLLWLLCALFFGSSIFYVKMEVARSAVHSGKGNSANLVKALILYLGMVLGIVLILSYLDSLPRLTVLAFVPLAIWIVVRIMRGFILVPLRLDVSSAERHHEVKVHPEGQLKLSIKKLGFTLVGHSIVFGIALTLIFLMWSGN